MDAFQSMTLSGGKTTQQGPGRWPAPAAPQPQATSQAVGRTPDPVAAMQLPKKWSEVPLPSPAEVGGCGRVAHNDKTAPGGGWLGSELKPPWG